MVQLAVAAVLAATAVAVATTPAAEAATKTPVSKLCPASRCQLQAAYAAKLLATRKALAKQYNVGFGASRTLPVLTLFDSARCRVGDKIVQPVHICWKKDSPKGAFNTALERTRGIIIKAEAERTGDCAVCPNRAFRYAGVCCKRECDILRKTASARRSQINGLKTCCALSWVTCKVLKKDVKKPSQKN